MRIAVIAGGFSPERDVSLSSGSLIANALIENGHSVCLLDLYKGVAGDPSKHLFYDAKSNKRFDYTVPQHEPDLNRLASEVGNGGALVGPNVMEICKASDLAFLALHGDIGENGKLQAFFDIFGVKYTGTGYTGSLLAMDKGVAKQLMAINNVLTPAWKLLGTELGSLRGEIEEIGFPCVIKPCGGGSSIGVSIVKNMGALPEAIEYVKKYEKTVLVEKMIGGREFSVGILGSQALPAIEIIPVEGFYDYKNKYQPGFTKEVCPAEIPGETMAHMQGVALRVHTILRLGDYSRIDFMLDSSGGLYCLEANTLPGMTPTSLLPQEAAAVGIKYPELCETIVQLALRHACGW